MMCACIQAAVRRYLLSLIFFLVVPVFWVYSQSAPPIEIRSVGFKPDDLGKMVLNYRVDESIEMENPVLYFFDNLELSPVSITYTKDPDDSTILFFDNPSIGAAGQMSFQLRTQAMGNAISSNIHSVIFLEEPEVLVADCLPAIRFSWWNYAVFDRGLDPSQPQQPPHFDSVKVYYWRKVGEGDCGRIPDTLEPETTMVPQPIGQSTLSLPVAADPGLYCLRIISESSEENLVSHSNTRELIIEGPEQPAPVSLTLVTVLPDNLGVKVVAYSGHEMDDSYHYGLFRSRDRNNFEYKLIGAYHGSDLAPDGRMVFRDDDTNRPWTEGSVYYYITTSLADCPPEFQVHSDTLSTLFLDARLEDYTVDRLTFILDWLRDPPLQQYEIHYKSPDNTEFEGYSESIANANTATVDLSDLGPISGRYQFRLKALIDNDTEIYSNTVSLHVEPRVNIVNAFRPESHREANRVFGPEFELVSPDEQGYHFRVFNRWHQLVYSSRIPPTPGAFPNRERRWDGYVDGHPAPPGVYVYVLEYVYGGEVFRKQGTVMLVR